MTAQIDRVGQARAIPSTDRLAAFEQRAAELEVWRKLLEQLSPDDWHRPTVCTEWDVADIVGHLIGQAEDELLPWKYPLRQVRARRRYPKVLRADAHMMVQADEHRGTPPERLRTEFAAKWAKANRALRRMPGLVRRVTLDSGIPGWQPVRLSWIQDVVLLRDLWMHRDDVCQATGAPLVIAAHDREVVAQVMRDVDTHAWPGPPVELELTGAAGGRWRLGTGEPIVVVRADAVAYMRTVSGRDDAPELELVSGDPAAVDAVAAVRFAF